MKNQINLKNKVMKKRRYIIGNYNPSARIIDLVSHTTFVVGPTI